SEEVRRERVAQHVRRQARCGYARFYSVALQTCPERLPRQRTAARRDEHRIGARLSCKVRACTREIPLDPHDRLLAERHEPLLAALAEDAHDAHVEAYRSDPQARQL